MRGQRHIFGGRADVRRVLYGRLGRHALQSGAQGLLSPSAGCGQAQEGSLGRLHAQTAGHHQCHRSKQNALER